jgi:Biotin-protein ligase, N terminal
MCFRRFTTASFPYVAVSIAALTFLTQCGSGNMRMPVATLPAATPSVQPVLLFIGSGTTASDVAAVESVLQTLNLSYSTADSTQLNAMSEQQMGGYKLLIVPGGDSITIGTSLTASTASAIRGAVQDYGVHYLGICAGAFFGGYSIYNGVNLTDGVFFNFYAAENQGIDEEPVEISFPNSQPLDVYWQDGPQLSGWGSVVAKFPDGTPAIVEGMSGSGFVVFTGVHLEAPASWRGTMVFTTPVSVDLAYAGTVFQSALNGTQLPHF